MTVDLPAPLAAYFAAENGNDPETLSRCFRAGATVRDEGRTIEGPAAIARWMAAAKAKYQHTVEPLQVATRDGKTVVTAKVSGNFPGSPANLEHSFVIEGGKIAALEIG